MLPAIMSDVLTPAPASSDRARGSRWLREFAVLEGLRDDDVGRLLAASHHLEPQPAGTVLYALGGPCQSVFLVLEGTVSIRAVPRGQLEAVELRRVGRGEGFGLEAAFGARTRHAQAVCETETRLIELPAELFARCVRRGSCAARGLERAVRRQLTDERLRTLAFTRELPAAERALVLDMVRQRQVAAGATLYREGQRADAMFLIASGMVRLFTTQGATRHVRAYLGAGDFFGEHETLAGGDWRLGAEAIGPCELLIIGRDDLRTLARRHPGLIDAMQRIAFDRHQAQSAAFDAASAARADADSGRTRHLFEDVYRASVATELLVIDLERCVSCGTCAWSCHETHGQARLVRRGDKVLSPPDALGQARPLLLPNSCQHCTDPACMVDCPTGAIGRDPAGEVFINAQTCVGCEACAKACPWDNIVMAPPAASGAQVAVKCDLCRGHGGVSACVSNCPTGAILRLDPSAESAPLRQLLGLPAGPDDGAQAAAPTPVRTLVPLVAGALVALLAAAGVVAHLRGLAAPYRGPGLAAGVLALLAMLGLAAYGVHKRTIGRRMRARRKAPERPLPRPLAWHYRLHLGLGGALLAALLLHTGGGVGGATTQALIAALVGSLLLGAAGAVLYRAVPPRVARLVTKPRLPEDFAAEDTRLRLALREVLSGRDDAKARAAASLAPLLSDRAAPWRALWRGEDRHALRARLLEVACAGGAPDDATRHALDRATRHVCDHLGMRAERLGKRLMAGWVLPHVVLSTVALLLALLHAVQGVLLLLGM